MANELAKYGVNMVDKEEQREYTLASLKDLAKAKGITHHPNIGYDKLYAKVFAE